MLLRGAGCPMATAEACVTPAVDTVDGAATASELAEGTAAPDWVGGSVGQESIASLPDARLGSNNSALDSVTDGASPPAIRTLFVGSKVAVCSQRAWLIQPAGDHRFEAGS